MEALTCLDYPRERFEVIVVDDGGEADLERRLAPFREEMALVALTQPHGGPAAARNTGARRARGEYLAFTDDDCAPSPEWLRVLAARLVMAPDCAVGGRVVNALPRNLCSTASQLLLAYLYAHFNADADDARFFATMNLALPAEAFRAIGGFDMHYRLAGAEDRDLCRRWLRRGCRMAYAPEAVVYHRHPLSPRSFWRQHRNYGRGASRYHRAPPGSAPEPVTLEPPAFYLKLLRYPFTQVRDARALPLAALLALSQAANACGYLEEQLRARRWHVGLGHAGTVTENAKTPESENATRDTRRLIHR